MLRFLLVLIAILSGWSIGLGQTSLEGRSTKNAIVVDSVAAEYAWVRKHFPGWRRTVQTLVPEGDRCFDELMLESPSGATETIYFDISSFMRGC